MSKAIAGYGGKAYVNEIKAAEIKEWDISIEREAIDATTLDSEGWSEKVPGIKSFSGSVNGLWNKSDLGQNEIYDAVTGDAYIYLELLPRDGVGEFGYAGDVVFTSFEVSSSTEGVTEFSASFEGSGKLSKITQTSAISAGTLGSLTYTTAAGTTSGTTKIVTVTPTMTAGNSYVVKVGAALSSIAYGEVLRPINGWEAYTLGNNITAASGAMVTLVEVSSAGLAVKAGSVAAVSAT